MFISKFGTTTLDTKPFPEISLGYLHTYFLRRDQSNAFTMDIDMQGKRIKNVPLKPDDINDVVSEAFVIEKNRELEQKAVLRNGLQSMTGHLDMNHHYINNVSDPVNDQDVVKKSYVDACVRNTKHVITIWAVKKKALDPSKFEWSFGHTLVEDCHGHQGYTMIKNGSLLGLGLSASNDQSDNPRFKGSISAANPGPEYCLTFGGPEMKVNIIVNGTENAVYSIIKPANHWSNTICFSTPFPLFWTHDK